jgi:hypothetical protein
VANDKDSNKLVKNNQGSMLILGIIKSGSNFLARQDSNLAHLLSITDLDFRIRNLLKPFDKSLEQGRTRVVVAILPTVNVECLYILFINSI